MKISLQQQIDAVGRELAQRKLSRGKMSRAEAEYHVERLEAALASLQWLQLNEPRIKEALGG